MRAVYVIALCVLVVIGLFAVRRSRTLPVPPTTARSPLIVLPSAPSPPPHPEQEDTPAFPATAGLACIQDALGGVQVFAGVSSLRIVGTTKVTAPATGPHPLASQREIGVVFPDS